MMEPDLPEGFAALAPFLAYWDVPTFEARWARRAAASMDDIRTFYEAMLPHAEKALDHVGQYPLDAMPGPAARLFRLCLALASASMSIELHRSVGVPYAPYPHRVRCVRGPAHWG